MNGSRAVEQVSANGSVDPLRTFRDHLKWQQERYKPFALRDYIEGMLDGKYPKPVRNAAQLLVDALTVQAPRLHPAGFKEYPVFSDRDDELAVKGIPRRIDVLMRYLHAEARLNAKDRALLLVGTSGAGKSTINGVLIDALERYTDQAEPAPVYGIVDCPINEEPLHVLDERTRAIWKEKHEVDITGHLCPECRSRAEQQVQRIEMAQVMHSGANIPLDFKVQALPFSQALGRGITRLAPNVTKFMVPNAPESINTAIMGSNRGILYMPEMGQPSQEFLKTLNDLMRGRRYDAKGRFYQLDCVIIADTTLDEWARFFKDSTNQGEKRLTASRLVNPPHFPPRSLQFLSSWSVRTRYRRPNDGIKIDEATKAKLYSGVNVGNFTQLDRKKIETEGEKAGEGIEGISPPAAWNIIFKLTGERMVWLEGDEERSCVDFVDLRRRAEEYIEDAPFNERIKSQMKEQLEVVTSEHDTWLQRTIEQAFQDR
ncbi:hypothetical protein HYW43_01890, partial [Candidatus Daviesbacteria bacterium]|nr:hypothetical protein [Candidatus Daviesbacteria bacterium]